MKNNFSLKFKVFDVFILIFAVACIAISIATTNIVFANSNRGTVQIYHQGIHLKEYDVKIEELDEEVSIVLYKEKHNGLLGDMTILVNKEKGVCISEVTCPNHTCEKLGWVNKVGYPIVCLPNNVHVIITSSSVDEDILI